MSKNTIWVFKTKKQAQDCVKEYASDPYVSVSDPIETNDGQWLLNVTLWECD